MTYSNGASLRLECDDKRKQRGIASSAPALYHNSWR
jgi:hypothetical protein